MALENFVNGAMLNNFAKKLKSNIKSDLLGDKKLRYLTQAEYDLLTDDEKNDENIIYNIIDADIEEGFSGDYNDLENRPCYQDKGDIPEYLNIEIYPDTDFSDKEYVEVINGTADNGNCIIYRKYVKLFSDITIDMINTMKEYGVFISKYEGQLIENPLIDLLDESQADQGMYSIGREFEFILQAPEGYYLPENGLWYEESYIDRDLNGNLIAEYKTVDDFEGILLIKDNGKLNTGTIKQLDEKFIPDTIATKKYVDDSINTTSIVRPYEVFRVDETIFGKTGYIDVETMEPSVKYGLTEEYLDCNTFGFVIPTATTPYAIVCLAASFQVSDLMVTEKWEGDPSKGEEGLYIIVRGLNVDYKINIRHKESQDGVTVEIIRNTKYLDINNTKEFIPTGDYQPATKKYVDDAKSIKTVTPSSFVDLYNICKGINIFPAFYKIQPTSTLSFTVGNRTVMVSGIWQVAFSSATGRMTFIGTSTECSFVLTADGFNQASIKYLTTNNTVEYTPTNDYNPATKKYVDDNKFSGDYNDLTNKPTIPNVSNYLPLSGGTIESSEFAPLKIKNIESDPLLLDTTTDDLGQSSSYYFQLPYTLDIKIGETYTLVSGDKTVTDVCTAGPDNDIMLEFWNAGSGIDVAIRANYNGSKGAYEENTTYVIHMYKEVPDFKLYAPLTDDASGPAISFENGDNPLGHLCIEERNGSFLRYNSDASSSYTIIDEENYSNIINCESIGAAPAESVEGLASESYVNNAVTQLNDNLQGQIDDLFQNVSNGKELIASAITDKGVDASEEETFQSLSEKIGLIPSGPPGSNIIGYINEENDIYVSLTELESGTYTLKFEDYKGLLDDFDDIGTVEVE